MSTPAVPLDFLYPNVEAHIFCCELTYPLGSTDHGWNCCSIMEGESQKSMVSYTEDIQWHQDRKWVLHTVYV